MTKEDKIKAARRGEPRHEELRGARFYIQHYFNRVNVSLVEAAGIRLSVCEPSSAAQAVEAFDKSALSMDGVFYEAKRAIDTFGSRPLFPLDERTTDWLKKNVDILHEVGISVVDRLDGMYNTGFFPREGTCVPVQDPLYGSDYSLLPLYRLFRRDMEAGKV